jgi:hypothetical protein
MFVCVCGARQKEIDSLNVTLEGGRGVGEATFSTQELLGLADLLPYWHLVQNIVLKDIT